MSFFITNMTGELMFLTVEQGPTPDDLIVSVTYDAFWCDDPPLFRKGLPRHGQEPVEVPQYRNGLHIVLQAEPSMRLVYTAVDKDSPDHTLSVRITSAKRPR